MITSTPLQPRNRYPWALLPTLLLALGLLHGSALPVTAKGPTTRHNANTPEGAAITQSPASDFTEGLRLLREVRDAVTSFDDPAFYWFCRYARDHAAGAEFRMLAGAAPTPWRTLLERPHDHRGRLVTVEGFLQARPDFTVSGSEHDKVGRLWQCELSQRGEPGLCAVVVVQDASHIPIHSFVRARGFFIKVRAYQTQGGEVDSGPLLVAPRLELVAAPQADVPGTIAPSAWFTRWLPLLVGLLAVMWLRLRRRTRAARRPRGAVAPGPPPPIESDADFKWLLRDENTDQKNSD